MEKTKHGVPLKPRGMALLTPHLGQATGRSTQRPKLPPPLAGARPGNALVSGPSPTAPAAAHPCPNLAAHAWSPREWVAIFETVYVGIPWKPRRWRPSRWSFPLIMLMQMLSAGGDGRRRSPRPISRAARSRPDLWRAPRRLPCHPGRQSAAGRPASAFSAIFVALGAPILRTLGGSGAVAEARPRVYAQHRNSPGRDPDMAAQHFRIRPARQPATCGCPRSRCLAAFGIANRAQAAAWASGIGPIPRLGLAGRRRPA